MNIQGYSIPRRVLIVAGVVVVIVAALVYVFVVGVPSFSHKASSPQTSPSTTTSTTKPPTLKKAHSGAPTLTIALSSKTSYRVFANTAAGRLAVTKKAVRVKGLSPTLSLYIESCKGRHCLTGHLMPIPLTLFPGEKAQAVITPRCVVKGRTLNCAKTVIRLTLTNVA